MPGLASRLRGTSAFTLIELLVVVLIVGILIAVSAPAFLSQSQKATDSASKQYLTYAWKAARSDAVSNTPQGAYSTGSALVSAIQASEPELTVAMGSTSCPGAADTNPKDVFIDPASSAAQIILCNDPSHTVWTLTATQFGPPVFTVNRGVTAGVSLPTNTALPAVTGTAQQAQTLTVSTGTWANSPTSYSYQWQSSPDNSTWANIAGATSTTYVVQSSDVSNYLRAQVTATNASGSTTASSAAVGPATAQAPQATTNPSLSGTAYQGQVLTGDRGQWTGTPTISYSYRWLRCSPSCSTVLASGSLSTQTTTYTVQSSDVSSTIEFEVTATNSAGSTVLTATSATVTGTYGSTVLADQPSLYYRLDQSQSFYTDWESYAVGSSPSWAYQTPGSNWTVASYSSAKVLQVDKNGNQPSLAILPNTMPLVRSVTAHLCDCENNSTPTPYPGIVVAYQDASNYDAVYIDAANHNLDFWKVRSGTATSGNLATGVAAIAENQQVEVSVGLTNSGSAVVDLNGLTVYKSDTNPSARGADWLVGTTKTGFWSWGVSEAGNVSWIDNYEVDPGATNSGTASGAGLYMQKYAYNQFGGGSGVADDGAGSTEFGYAGDMMNGYGTSYAGTPSAFTIEAVAVRYAPNPTATTVLAGFSSGPQLDYLSNGTLQCAFPATTGTFYTATSPSSVMGAWTFSACVYDDTTLRLYLNGALAASATPPGGTLVRADATTNGIASEFDVGGFAWYSNADAAGYVDEAAWYPGKALSATQVQAHYAARSNS